MIRDVELPPGAMNQNNPTRRIMLKFIKAGTALGLALAMAWPATPSFAGNHAAEFFKDRQVRIAIGYGFGGTYGRYSRTMAEFLPQYIPGNPTVIVISHPGAGGIKMTNYAAQVMPRQGYNWLMPPDMSVVSQLMRPTKVKYDARKFTWLGASNQTNTITVVRTDTGVKNWADLQKTQVITGHTGPGSTSFVMPSLYKNMMGANFKVIGGYKGSRNTVLAMERGEIQSASFNWLAWNAIVPQWFVKDKDGKTFARAILQLGHFKDPGLPGLPMARDMAKPGDRAIIAFLATHGLIGRSLALPPGAPNWLVKPLRAAFDKMNADPKYKSTLEKRRLRLIPSTGAVVQKAVMDAFAGADPKVVARARKIVFGK
jgi:tripartite-type tricarboxylate transporter receptor subunit TctC